MKMCPVILASLFSCMFLLTACGGGGGSSGERRSSQPSVSERDRPMLSPSADNDTGSVSPDNRAPDTDRAPDDTISDSKGNTTENGNVVDKGTVSQPKSSYTGYLKQIQSYSSDNIVEVGFLDFSPQGDFIIEAEGDNLRVTAVAIPNAQTGDSRTVSGQRLIPLHNARGDLAGYYGYINTVTHINDESLDEDKRDYVTLSLVSLSSDVVSRRPEMTATYNGTAFLNKEGILQTGNIFLRYSEDKVTGYLEMKKENTSYILNDKGNDVGYDGSFAATMYNQSIHNKGANDGNISGKFYGEQAEIAIGEIELRPVDGQSERKGFFGAQKQEK